MQVTKITILPPPARADAGPLMAHENPRNVDIHWNRILDRARGRRDIEGRFSGPGNDTGNCREQNRSGNNQNDNSSSHESLLGRMPAGLEYRTSLQKIL
jgi:hypothetical protein